MKVLESEEKLCLSCMEKHQVDLVEVTDSTYLKGKRLNLKPHMSTAPRQTRFKKPKR